jgi:hypothetical protein
VPTRMPVAASIIAAPDVSEPTRHSAGGSNGSATRRSVAAKAASSSAASASSPIVRAEPQPWSAVPESA